MSSYYLENRYFYYRVIGLCMFYKDSSKVVRPEVSVIGIKYTFSTTFIIITFQVLCSSFKYMFMFDIINWIVSPYIHLHCDMFCYNLIFQNGQKEVSFKSSIQKFLTKFSSAISMRRSSQKNFKILIFR